MFIPAMFVFLGGSVGLTWLDNGTETPNAVLAVLAIVPIVALLSMFWLHWRFLQDIDEFLRQIQIKALLFGAAIALGFGTAWGYFEMYIGAPAISVFWLNPLFWAAYALGVVFFSRTDGASLR